MCDRRLAIYIYSAAFDRAGCPWGDQADEEASSSFYFASPSSRETTSEKDKQERGVPYMEREAACFFKETAASPRYVARRRFASWTAPQSGLHVVLRSVREADCLITRVARHRVK